MNCREFNQQDIVDYLLFLGHKPAKINGNDHWYLSPFRNEQTPSFKVNRKFNVWYDHGLQKGGKLVDFGVLFYNCTVNELLHKLTHQDNFSFQQQNPHERVASFSGAGEKEKIIVVDARHPIRLLSLQEYLQFRKIPLEIANRFCKEVDFNLYDRKYTVIGFQNSAGGYELRSANFKGSSSPKEVTLIGKDISKEIAVFEGFMDFLSYQAIHWRKFIMLPKQQPNFLILNSIGFLEKIKPRLEQHPSIHLYLDRDNKGLMVTKEVVALGRKYRDESTIYKNHKDLNEFLMNQNPEQRQSQRSGMRF
ncbi:DNA primase [Sediminibacterium roseum]|uniref:DNA primase n=1 Tax=Sediminibacterium roseum TaxID=1978412 RepID=A0ABW9ZRP8_9BACT|nr:toprim domain-containing protein [Sediminibacterium roseum]NCI49787.1 DNA primase [Sediminibacterium roseum]